MKYKQLIALTIALAVSAFTGSDVMAHGGVAVVTAAASVEEDAFAAVASTAVLPVVAFAVVAFAVVLTLRAFAAAASGAIDSAMFHPSRMTGEIIVK